MATHYSRCSIPQIARAAIGLVFKAFPGAAIPGLAGRSELPVERGIARPSPNGTFSEPVPWL